MIFNVPLDSEGKIADTTRIDKTIPTIKYILNQGASRLTMMAHLGRPKERNKKDSLAPVGLYLAEQLEQEVILSETSTDRGIKTLLNLPPN